MQIKTVFSEKDIRNLNQYLYDNSITLSKSQKTLFIASVLISLKIDDKILDGYDESTNSFLIADRMIDIINNYYEDPLFTNNFNFIKKSIHNKHLYHIFNVINIDIKKYGKDILNQFYSEFCIWDRNNDGKLGIVLTPDDIVDIMVNESFKYYYELNGNKDNIKVIDLCMGTGSFLIKSSNYTKLLYGCENGDERYSLAKCNFILNDLDYNNLKYDSCFNVKYNNNYFDISIINPPFSNRCQDELNPNNTTNWKSYTKEQRFIMYQLELLKVGGIGCCIVPRSNFNNNVKATNNFKHEFMKYVKILSYYKCNSKVFMPNASVECVIIIYQKINKLENPIESEDVEVINYFDDGYKLKKNIRVKYSEPNLLISNKTLKWDNDFIRNFLFVGRMVFYKHPQAVAEALYEVYPQKDFFLRYIGQEDTATKSTSDYVLNNQLGDAVSLLGKIEREKIINWYDKSDCFVMISDHEVFGLVYLEAMSRGCITIAGNNGGMEGIIKSGENGFLCTPGNAEELASIIKMINKMSAAEKKRISDNAKQTARDFSDWNAAEIYLKNILK